MAGESERTADEYEAIESTRQRLVPVGGREVAVCPLKVGQLPAFASAVRPLLPQLNSFVTEREFNLAAAFDLVEQHFDTVLIAAAAATSIPEEEIQEAAVDEFVELVVAIFAVNVDFFVKRLLPSLERDLAELGELVRALPGSGRTQSST